MGRHTRRVERLPRKMATVSPPGDGQGRGRLAAQAGRGGGGVGGVDLLCACRKTL